jgi:hypothetical protein
MAEVSNFETVSQHFDVAAERQGIRDDVAENCAPPTAKFRCRSR